MKLKTFYDTAKSNGVIARSIPNVDLGEHQKIRFAIMLANKSKNLSEFKKQISPEIKNFISNSSDELIDKILIIKMIGEQH